MWAPFRWHQVLALNNLGFGTSQWHSVKYDRFCRIKATRLTSGASSGEIVTLDRVT